MVVDVYHPSRPNVSKDDLRDRLAKMYKSPKEQVIVFGFRTVFGGGRSTGFALVESLDTQQANRLIWSPDVFGSIAFLWSSWLAFIS